MAKYYTQFDGYEENVNPHDWTKRWHVDDQSWRTYDRTGKTGDWVVRHVPWVSYDSQRLLSWDDIPTEGVSDTQEIVTRCQTNSRWRDQFQVIARGFGGNDNKHGYIAAINGTADELRIYKWFENTRYEMAAIDYTITENVWYWLRLRVEGFTIYAKIWEDGEEEPQDWTMSATDVYEDLPNAGWVGVGAHSYEGFRFYDVVGVGTDGDTAPIEELPPPVPEREVTSYVRKIVSSSTARMERVVTSYARRITSSARIEDIAVRVSSYIKSVNTKAVKKAKVRVKSHVKKIKGFATATLVIPVVPEFIEIFVFDRDYRRIADLNPDLIDHSHTEIKDLTGEFTSSFIYPITAVGSQSLEIGHYFAYRDLDGNHQLFEIVDITRSMDSDGRKAVTVYGEHVYYELATEKMLNFSLVNVSAEFAVYQALNETNWVTGEIADLGLATVHFVDDNPLEALIKIVASFDGELLFRAVLSHTGVDSFVVDIKERRGRLTGKRFEIGHDINNVSVTKDFRNLRTALYGRGQGLQTAEEDNGEIERIDFSGIEWIKGDPTPAVGDPEGGLYTGPEAPVDKPLGQHWIGDEEARLSYGKKDLETDERKHIFGVYESQAEFAENLIWETWRRLQAVKNPEINIEARVADLEQVPGFEHEKLRLGDDVYLIAPDIIEPVSARVLRIERRRKDPGNTVVELGNYRPASSRDLIKELLENRRRFEARQAIFERSEFFEKVDEDAEVGTDYAYALDIGQRSIRVIGDTEFFWDGSGLYAVNPEDYNNYWRFDKDGLRLTKDGGLTFVHNLALDFVEIGTDASFAGRLEAVEGSFVDLFAGTEEAARIELGEEAGEPFLKMFDEYGDIRILIGEKEIEFWRMNDTEGLILGGTIRAEYLSEPVHGIVPGDCLYFITEGRTMAFNAAGEEDEEETSMLVHPTDVWTIVQNTQFLAIGWEPLPTVRWLIYAYGADDTILSIYNGFPDEDVGLVEIDSNTTVLGDFDVTGAKNSVVRTDNYGYRKFSALETPDIRFMTIIEKELEGGVSWVDIEPMFAESINGYEVLPFVTGEQTIEILKKQANRFQVRYEGETKKVNFMVYGKRKGYENIYLKEAEDINGKRKEREKIVSEERARQDKINKRIGRKTTNRRQAGGPKSRQGY